MIAVLPLGILRTMLYRALLRYDIRSSRIGWGTIIAVDSFCIDTVSIGNFNLFTGPFSFLAGSGSTIGSTNVFQCGKWAAEKRYADRNFGRSISVGANVIITNKHYFDIVGHLEIGHDSWIAGYGSQFWTHGGNKADIDIVIGNQCYIASSVCLVPGASIADNTIVGIGSVVTKKFTEPKTLIAGNPAIVKKTNYSWQNDLQ